MSKKSAKAKSQLPQAVTSEEVAKMTKQVENIPTVYFNHARVAAGFLDFRIFFGEQTVSPTGQVSFKESLCVAMTPEFANLFYTLLGQQIVAFQKLFGGFRAMPLAQNAAEFRKLVESLQKQQAAVNPLKQ